MSKIYLGSWASVADKDNIWFSNFNLNGLFRYDIKKKRIFFECFFEHSPIDVDLLHYGAYECGDNIIFVPYNKTKFISIYDKEKHFLTSIGMPEASYGPSVKIENNIYILTEKQNLLIFDTVNRIIYTDNYLSSLIKNVWNDNSNIRINTSDSSIIFVNSLNNNVVELNMANREKREMWIDNKYADLMNIYYLEGKYWITRLNTPNLLSFEKDGRITEYNYKENDIEWLSDIKLAYSQIVSMGDFLLLPGYYYNGVMILDHKRNNMYKIHLPDDYKVRNERGYGATYRNVHRINDKVYIIPQRANKLVVIDFFDNDLEYIDFSIELDELPEYREYYKEKMQKEIITEGTSDYSTIDFFIEVVSS